MSTETLWVGGWEHVVFHLNPHVLSTGACPAWAGALGKLESHAFKISCFFMHNKTPIFVSLLDSLWRALFGGE